MGRYDKVTAQIIENLEKGTPPWVKPWQAARPMNGKTGRPYRGVSRLNLSLTAHEDPRFLTFLQVKELGGYVKKGEHGYAAIGFFDKNRPDQSLPEELDTPHRPNIRARVFTVFNVEQTSGIAPEKLAEIPTHRPFNAIEEAEGLVRNTNAQIYHNGGDRAFYRPSTDTIHLPSRESFVSEDHYYATTLHELTHWTGHPDRLNRTFGLTFGSPDYAKEELVAELGASFLCADVGIGSQISHNAAYLQSWLDVLKKNPDFLVVAGQQAERAAGYVLDLDPTRVRRVTPQPDLEGVEAHHQYPRIPKIAVIGSRTFNDEQLMDKTLSAARQHLGPFVLVSGGARGADSLAEGIAQTKGWPSEIYRANWERDGKRAGFVRNHTLIQNADAVIAYWDGQSKGTQHSLKLAMEAQKPQWVFKEHDRPDFDAFQKWAIGLKQNPDRMIERYPAGTAAGQDPSTHAVIDTPKQPRPDPERVEANRKEFVMEQTVEQGQAAAEPSKSKAKAITERNVQAHLESFERTGSNRFDVGFYDPANKENPFYQPKWLRDVDAAKIMEAVGGMMKKNIEGQAVLIRPVGEHVFTVHKGLTENDLETFKEKGFPPYGVTSVGNKKEVVVNHGRPMDYETRGAFSVLMNQEVPGETKANGFIHLAGFKDPSGSYVRNEVHNVLATRSHHLMETVQDLKTWLVPSPAQDREVKKETTREVAGPQVSKPEKPVAEKVTTVDPGEIQLAKTADIGAYALEKGFTLTDKDKKIGKDIVDVYHRDIQELRVLKNHEERFFVLKEKGQVVSKGDAIQFYQEEEAVKYPQAVKGMLARVTPPPVPSLNENPNPTPSPAR